MTIYKIPRYFSNQKIFCHFPKFMVLEIFYLQISGKKNCAKSLKLTGLAFLEIYINDGNKRTGNAKRIQKRRYLSWRNFNAERNNNWSIVSSSRQLRRCVLSRKLTKKRRQVERELPDLLTQRRTI